MDKIDEEINFLERINELSNESMTIKEQSTPWTVRDSGNGASGRGVEHNTDKTMRPKVQDLKL